jgi:WD40 repeat protein
MARRLALALAALLAAAVPARADDTSLAVLADGSLVAQYGGLSGARFAVLAPDAEVPADAVTLWGPALDITAAASSADGRRFAVATRDGRVLALAADGGVLAQARLGRARVRAVALSADGALVAAGSNGGEIGVWRLIEAAGGARLERVAEAKSGGGDVSRIVFAPGNEAVLATDGSVFATLSLPQGAVATLKGRTIAGLAAGRAGLPVLYEADRGFLHYDAAKGRALPFGPPLKLGEGGAFAVSPKGDLVAALDGTGTLTLIGADGRVRARWTGAARMPKRDGETPRGLLAFAPDGASLAVQGGDGALALWSLDATAAGRPNAPPPRRRTLGGGWRSVFDDAAVLFRDDGRLLVLTPLAARRLVWSADGRRRGDAINLRASAEGPLLALPDGALVRGEKSGRLVLHGPVGASAGGTRSAAAHPGGVTALAATRDGAFVATGGDDEAVRLWRRDLSPVAAMPAAHFGAVAALAFAPDGQRLVSGGVDGTLRFWSAGGAAIGAPVEATSERIAAIAASPGGDVLAVGDSKGGVRLWSWDGTPAGPAFRADSETVYAILFLPDGASLLVSGQTGLRRWSRDGKPLGAPLSGGSGAIALVPGGAPDGPIVAHLSVRFADRGVVRFWRLDGTAPRTPLVDVPAPPTALAFAPDGAWLAIGDDAGLVRRWTPGAGPPALAPTSHAATIVSLLALGGAAPGFVSVDRAGAFVLWAAADLAPTRAFTVRHDYIFSVAAAPDGSTLATGDRDGTIRVVAADGTVRAAWRPEGDNAVNGLAFAGANEIVARLFGRAGDVHWFALDGARTRRPNETRLGRLLGMAHAPVSQRLALALERDGGYALLAVDAAGAVSPPLARRAGGEFPAVAAAPDGAAFAFGDDEGGVHLVGADGVLKRPPWAAHDGAVRALVFAPDGRRLASLGADGAIRLWSLDGQRLDETRFAP